MRLVIILTLGLLLLSCGGAPAEPATTVPSQPSPTTQPVSAATQTPPAPPTPSAADYLEQGTALVEQGELEQALLAYKAAVLLEPGNALAHHGLGSVHSRLGNGEQALAELLEAGRLAPQDATIHSDLCDVYSDQGRMDEALAACNESVRLDPGFAMAHNNLGHLLFAGNDLEAAAHEFQEAIRLDPTLAMAHTNLGAVYHTLGRVDDAAAEYEAAIRLDPGDAAAHYNLGNLYAPQDSEKALAEWQEAIRIDPAHANAHLNLGIAYEQMGRGDEAIAEFEAYLQLRPDSPDREAVEAEIAKLRGGGQALPGEYTDLLGGYRLRYPDGWVAAPQKDPGIVLLAPDEPDPSLMLIVLAKPASFFEAELGAGQILTASQLAAALAGEYGLDLQTMDGGVVAGVPALSATAPRQAGGGLEQTMRQIFLVGRGTGYVISYVAPSDQWAAFEPTGQAMVASFTLAQPAVTAVYSSQAGGYRLSYPEGWAVEDKGSTVMLTPLAGLQPDDAPYVALFSGRETIASTFKMEGQVTPGSVLGAFVKMMGAQTHGLKTLTIGGVEHPLTLLTFEVDGVLVAGRVTLVKNSDPPLMVLACAPASQWASFEPAVEAMLAGLTFDVD